MRLDLDEKESGGSIIFTKKRPDQGEGFFPDRCSPAPSRSAVTLPFLKRATDPQAVCEKLKETIGARHGEAEGDVERIELREGNFLDRPKQGTTNKDSSPNNSFFGNSIA